ncbi:hypothetical protein BaRGS_00016052, partial [Batillaria attramentaria]
VFPRSRWFKPEKKLRSAESEFREPILGVLRGIPPDHSLAAWPDQTGKHTSATQ